MDGRQPLRHEPLCPTRSSTDTAPPVPGHLLEGGGSSFKFERTSFTPAPQQSTSPPPSPMDVNRLFKPDPLVLAMAVRCGCEEANTPSPTRMPHPTSSTDMQHYLVKTTATSGSGLQNETSASHSGPSHPELASPMYWRLYPRSFHDVRGFQVTAVGPRRAASYTLQRC